MNFLENYSGLNNIERREAICRWHLQRAKSDISWIEIKDKIAAVIAKMIHCYGSRYNSQLHFYKGIDGAGQTVFDGLSFNKEWVMRDILMQDGLIEIESQNKEFNWQGTLATCNNLQKFGIAFVVFDHSGRSPHIHIYGLFPDIENWAEKELAMAMFCLKVVPEKYYPFVDKALFGDHTISLEFSQHYKTGEMNKPILFYSPEEKCNH